MLQFFAANRIKKVKLARFRAFSHLPQRQNPSKRYFWRLEGNKRENSKKKKEGEIEKKIKHKKEHSESLKDANYTMGKYKLIPLLLVLNMQKYIPHKEKKITAYFHHFFMYFMPFKEKKRVRNYC